MSKVLLRFGRRQQLSLTKREEEKQKKTIELEYPSNNKAPFVPSLFFIEFSLRVLSLFFTSLCEGEKLWVGCFFHLLQITIEISSLRLLGLWGKGLDSVLTEKQ